MNSPGAIRTACSMATREVLGDLAKSWREKSGGEVAVEPIAGVEAARRVREGEAFDVIVLADDVIATLELEGPVEAGSRVPVADAEVVVAVRSGTPHPDISTEAALRKAVVAAPTVGYSTGPSGNYLLRLFERWCVTEAIAARLVLAPPGVPVGKLIAAGEAALGFQQRSELIDMPGVDIVGPLPAEVQLVTTFSAGLCVASARKDTARAWLAFLASSEGDAARRLRGMSPPRCRSS
jgi:molybdate transport system substrate-binding protein